MDKQSSLKMAQVVHDTRVALTSVTAERDKLAAENAAYKRREEATKVASVLHDKGIHRDIEFSALVENLEKEAEAGHLGEISRAADMIGPNMIFGSTHNDQVVEGGNHAFTDFLVGSVG